MTAQQYDIIIIGAGIAGLSAALQAAKRGIRVCVLLKSNGVQTSNSWWAQGGIVYKEETNDTHLLQQDILKVGSDINNLEIVELISQIGPELIDKYLLPHVSFDKTKEELDLTREGGHSLRRILHSKDQTGRAIVEPLLAYLRQQSNIDFLFDAMAIDIITNTHHSKDPEQKYKKKKVLGVYVLSSSEIRPIFSPSVIIATGGIGAVYLHSTNPPTATGDGIAMAYRAGCEIINTEYIQFHPTTLYHRDAERFLLSEALRGEGAVLLNRAEEAFMARYNPEKKDLAARDETTRAIFKEMGNHNSYVYLDARNLLLNPETRFPSIYARCKKLGLDMNSHLIPVVPSAHYICGGIKTDEWARTDIVGLYAVGEVACTGLHGANRLASMSLLEGFVFGIRAVQNISRSAHELSNELVNSIPEWISPPQVSEFDPILITHDLLTIQTTMWDYVGIVRNRKRLKRALADLQYFSHSIENFYKEALPSQNIIELRNAVLTAKIIARSALANTKSLGCHYRED